MREPDAGVVLTRDREPPQPLEEQLLEDQPEPEDRHRHAQHREQPDQRIGPAVAIARGHDAERQSDRHTERERGDHELERRRHCRGQVVEHGPVGVQRGAPVADRHASHVVSELNRPGPLEPEVVANLLELGAARSRAGVCHRRVARHEPGDREGDDDDADDHDDRLRQPAREEPRHVTRGADRE